VTLAGEVPPLFRFGTRRGAQAADPLAIVSGGLILDGGEAEHSFVYRCQDRFLTYSALMGWRSLFFAVDDRHVDMYRAHVAALAGRLAVIASRTGLFGETRIETPLFLLADLETLEISAPATLGQQLQDPGLVAAAQAGIALNQVAPTYARLVRQAERLLAYHGLSLDWGPDACARMGDLALRLHDKANWIDLIRAFDGADLHVPTAVVTTAELRAVRDWPDLTCLFCERTGSPAPGSLFLKSSRNSAGNLAARIGPAGFGTAIDRFCGELEADTAPTSLEFDRKMEELQSDVDAAPCFRPLAIEPSRLQALRWQQAERRGDLRVLIQPDLDGGAASGGFASLGLSFLVGDAGAVTPLAVGAQLYRDPARRHFLGSYLVDTHLPDGVRQLLARTGALGAELSRLGYRGPVGFDAMRTTDGAYRLIHDCNPRLTAVFPSLAVRDWLSGAGFPAHTVATLGYRGEFVLPDPAGAMQRLDSAGLLYTATHQRGAILLPNLCRDHGYDVHLVDVSPPEINSHLAPGGVLATLSARPLAFEATFF
jgi:hypothetical protein